MHEKILKRVNIKTLRLCFLKIIFREAEDKEDAIILNPFDSSRLMLISLIDNYYYSEKDLDFYFFDNYIKVISYIKYNTKK